MGQGIAMNAADKEVHVRLHLACQNTEIPLHPGAEAYYPEHGYLG